MAIFQMVRCVDHQLSVGGEKGVYTHYFPTSDTPKSYSSENLSNCTLSTEK